MPPAARTPLRAVSATVCAAAVLLSACSGSGYRYIKNSSTKTYFRVPERWTVFDQDSILAGLHEQLSPQGAAQSRLTQWVVAFDSAPKPSIDHVLDEHSTFPMGFVRVRALQQSERETLSIQKMRNEALPLDQFATQDDLEPLKITDIVRPGGLHGTHEVHNIKVQGGFFTIDQTALVDPHTRLLYLLVLGCEARCYLDHKKVIDDVVRSWTIKER